MAVHETAGDCINPNPAEATFNNIYTAQLDAFAVQHPDVPAPATSRFHCVAWPDWSTHAKVEAEHGIRLDTELLPLPACVGAISPDT